MLADCATPSVQVNKSSLVVHRDQEGGKTYTPRRREYYYYLCMGKRTFKHYDVVFVKVEKQH